MFHPDNYRAIAKERHGDLIMETEMIRLLSKEGKDGSGLKASLRSGLATALIALGHRLMPSGSEVVVTET